VPVGEGLAVGLDDQVLVEAGVVLADLGVGVFDKDPQASGLWRLVGEVEPDHHSMLGEPFAGQVGGAPGP
jgi:hypothetical protein